MAQVIERLHTVYVDTDALLSQKRRQLGITSSVLVSRNVKRNNTHVTKCLQRFIDRRSGLVEFKFFLFHINLRSAMRTGTEFNKICLISVCLRRMKKKKRRLPLHSLR